LFLRLRIITIPLQNITEAQKRIREVVNKTQFAYVLALSHISGVVSAIKQIDFKIRVIGVGTELSINEFMAKNIKKTFTILGLIFSTLHF
jgi:threonine dehydratase